MKFERIYLYGEKVLREKASPIEEVNDRIRAIARAMLECMYEANGVGLAAQQVGLTEAICVVDTSGGVAEREEGESRSDPGPVPMPLVLINPRLEQARGQERSREGCLSFPGMEADITRASEIEITFMDLQGRIRRITARHLLGRAIQHEVDHLNGVLLIDRVSAVQRMLWARDLRRCARR